MDRRTFVGSAFGGLLVLPLAAHAQPRPRRIARVATAKTLGLTIPQSLLLRADEVIQ